jgi:hypothetical protein
MNNTKEGMSDSMLYEANSSTLGLFNWKGKMRRIDFFLAAARQVWRLNTCKAHSYNNSLKDSLVVHSQHMCVVM